MIKLVQIRICRAAMPWLLCGALTTAARAEHAAINLKVIGPQGRQEAFSDQEPPAGGVNPRPQLTVNAGDPLVLDFLVTNVYPHGLLEDVTVRYFVVRRGESRGDQAADVADGVVLRGEATLNFKPKCRVGARLKFRVDEPGSYLVRVETRNTKSDHEHFSAIDLEVK